MTLSIVKTKTASDRVEQVRKILLRLLQQRRENTTQSEANPLKNGGGGEFFRTELGEA